MLGHELGTVADAQHRQTRLKYVWRARRRARVVDACRAAGEDDALRPQCFHAFPRRVTGQQLTVDAALPHSPGDELAVLRPEIEAHYALTCKLSSQTGPW